MTVAYEQDWCFGRPSEEPKVEFTLEEAKRVRIAIAIAMLLTKSVRYKKELPKLFGQIDKRIKETESKKL